MSFFTPIRDTFRKLLGIELPVGDWETAGPAEDEHPIVKAKDVFKANTGGHVVRDVYTQPRPPITIEPAWTFGLWKKSTFTPMNPGRVGGQIVPQAVVVHTTDMHPDTHAALVKNWIASPGAGNGAHFLIGRTPEIGVTQFCSITRNSNHAGGPKHGWFKTDKGALVHPNTITVGIELHCAGRLYKSGLDWRCGEYQNGKLVLSGTPIPPAEVFIDGAGRGWHRCTDYQLQQLRALLTDLAACFAPWPDLNIVPNGDYKANGVPWASLMQTRFTTHVTLDPNNKTDPGPTVLAWIKEHY